MVVENCRFLEKYMQLGFVMLFMQKPTVFGCQTESYMGTTGKFQLFATVTSAIKSRQGM